MTPWIQTWSGRAFDLLDPKPDQVCLEDVAHALSRICRYTGHVEGHYSVAQHSVLVMHTVVGELGQPEHALAALLHDAAEAYVGDVSAPLKLAMRELESNRNQGFDMTHSTYDLIEKNVQEVVERALGLEIGSSRMAVDIVKRADLMLLAKEASVLMKSPPREWNLPEDPAQVAIVPWSAQTAESEFLSMHRRWAGWGRRGA